jgi:superfamily II DNA/RNA helicase
MRFFYVHRDGRTARACNGPQAGFFFTPPSLRVM